MTLIPPDLPAPAERPSHGTCDARFAAVREALDENFRSRGELGAGVCVIEEGRTVVDLFGGWSDRARTRPWRTETSVNVFSVGKGLLAALVGVLVDRYGLDLDARVAHYWPEFAQADKGHVPVRWLASHRAGLPGIRERLPTGAIYDWDRMAALLAAERPWWAPGEAHGYHVNTYGYLIGELALRVSGATVETLLTEHFARPLDAEVSFGARGACARDVADTQISDGPIELPGEDAEHRELVDRAYANPQGISGNGTVNTPAWRAAVIPSTNAHATARGVARVYAGLLAQRGVSRETLRELVREQAYGLDRVLRRPTRFGVGFQLASVERPLGPHGTSFGHFGAGGSLGFADPEAGLAFGYVINQPGPRWQNPRTLALVDAVYASLG